VRLTPCPDTTDKGANKNAMLNKIKRGTAKVLFFKPDLLLCSGNVFSVVEHLLLGEHFKLYLSL